MVDELPPPSLRNMLAALLNFQLTCRATNTASTAKRARDGVSVKSVSEQRWARPDIKSVSLLPNVLAKQSAIPGSDCVAIGHPVAGMLWTVRSGEVAGETFAAAFAVDFPQRVGRLLAN